MLAIDQYYTHRDIAIPSNHGLKRSLCITNVDKSAVERGSKHAIDEVAFRSIACPAYANGISPSITGRLHVIDWLEDRSVAVNDTLLTETPLCGDRTDTKKAYKCACRVVCLPCRSDVNSFPHTCNSRYGEA